MRIILSPLFLIAFFIPVWTDGQLIRLSVLMCWIFMFIMDLSDLLDGIAARKLRLVSDFGKMFDPYADLFARLTYFLCFVGIGMMPVWMFTIILYREITVTFLRMIMMKWGVTMAARMGGKIKEWVYAAAAITSLLAVSLDRFGADSGILSSIMHIAMMFYVLSVIFSLISFMDYLNLVYKKNKESVDKSRDKVVG